MENNFVNKVAESGIVTLDLEDFLPKEEIAVFDIKDYLFMGLILKEKDFREALKNLDASVYNNKIVAITCSADAIIPMWAYMLIAGNVQPYAKAVIFGDIQHAEESQLLKNIEGINTEVYRDQRMVIKGCGEKHIPEAAYVKITELLRPVAKSIMFGEPCSTVPIYKRPKEG
ncbi:MAG: DUF2480 family protein [Ferruginibacter sp.]